MKLYDKTVHELHDLLKKKEISSLELTKNVLARMDEVDQHGYDVFGRAAPDGQ